MSYTRTEWVSGETPLSADNMNNIEDGIEELKSEIDDKSPLISTKDFTITAFLVQSGAIGSGTIDASYEGYTLLGLLNVTLTDKSYFDIIAFTTRDNTIDVTVHNRSTGQHYAEPRCRALYVKNS